MLHCLGPIVQHIFNTLSGEHKTLEEVKTAVSGHFAQKADESIDTYLTSLRELIKSCDFRTLEEMTQEMFFSYLEAETSPTGPRGPRKDDQNCVKYREGCTRSSIAVTRHLGQPNPFPPPACLWRISNKTVQPLQIWRLYVETNLVLLVITKFLWDIRYVIFFSPMCKNLPITFGSSPCSFALYIAFISFLHSSSIAFMVSSALFNRLSSAKSLVSVFMADKAGNDQSIISFRFPIQRTA